VSGLFRLFILTPFTDVQGSDVVFAKSYRGEVLLTIIWYGPTGRYYVSLTPAGGEEQALVDTLFPSIYGKRRGAHLGTYEVPTGVPRALMGAFNGDQEPQSILKELQTATEKAGGDATDSKLADRAAAIGTAASSSILPAWKLFTAVSIWEASEPVPDPDDLRDASAEDDEDADGEDDDDDSDNSDFDEETAALDVKESGPAADSSGLLLDESGLDASGSGGSIDLTGGSGYTQVYIVLSPDLSPLKEVLKEETYNALARKLSTASSSAASSGSGLIPRAAMFRFGDWVYAGVVDFPVDALRLGDVPFVLPALQKQQGRLEFLSEAKAFPVGELN
jgi:hypothetical protein